MPYHDQTGAPAGFITALVDLGWLEDYLVRKPLPAGASITMADRHGTVLARVPEVPGVVGKPLPEAYRPLLERQEAAASNWSVLTASCGCRAMPRQPWVRGDCSS